MSRVFKSSYLYLLTNGYLTIGDKEMEKKCLAVRTRAGEVKFEVKLADFLKQLEEERK